MSSNTRSGFATLDFEIMYKYNVHKILLQHPITPPLKVFVSFPMSIVAVKHINTSRF